MVSFSTTVWQMTEMFQQKMTDMFQRKKNSVRHTSASVTRQF